MYGRAALALLVIIYYVRLGLRFEDVLPKSEDDGIWHKVFERSALLIIIIVQYLQ